MRTTKIAEISKEDTKDIAGVHSSPKTLAEKQNEKLK
jgi:hypothetical protein